MKKEAIAKVSAIELCYKEEVTWVEAIHRKGDKALFGLREHKEDCFRYKKVTNFHSVDELASFISKGIMIDSDNKIWIVPQVCITRPTSSHTGEKSFKVYDTNEEAEAAFKNLVAEYNLTEI